MNMIEWEAPALTRTTAIDGDGLLEVTPEYFGAPPGVSGGAGGGPGMIPVFPFGYMARPRDPDVDAEGGTGDGAGCLYFTCGGQGYATPLFDERLVGLVPVPAKGGAVLFGDAGAGKVALLTLSGDDGTVEITVPSGAVVRLKASNGRRATLSSTGLDVIGTVNAGVVSAEDPGAAPSPVAVAAPLASYIATLEQWAVQADAWMALVSALPTVGVPISPPFLAAIVARVAAAATIAGTYPGGMTATRLNAR